MDFVELMKKRYSVRKFAGEPVGDDDLARVLEAVMLAPTAKNLQPQRVYVLQSPEALEKLDGLTHCRYGAATVLLFAYDTAQEWKNPLEEGVHSGVEDASIAATQAMLEATELGLATCWCNYFPNTELERALGLPESERSVLIMPIGRAADGVRPAPLHGASKDESEIVRYM